MLHFGESGFAKHKLEMDFDKWKKTYQSYEQWNPKKKFVIEEKEPMSQAKIDKLMDVVRDNTQNARHRFEFQ